MSSITALVPTFNREAQVRDCLESVKWADQILVVDSYSTDATLDICREYTDDVHQHEYVNSKTQKNWALQFVTTEWVIQVDSDERVEPALADEIRQVINANPQEDGFWILIKNLIWGRYVPWPRRYACVQVRLFRAAKGKWSDRAVHARVEGISRVGELQNAIIHHDIEDISEELVQFAEQVIHWEYEELMHKGKQWRWWDVTLRPFAIFLLCYLWRGGWRNGFRGYYLSMWRAIYSFLVHTKVYQEEVKRDVR
jgi:glycosyltransferase involved in cell wall biosynthesis